MTRTKICPFCGSKIAEAAHRCRFCGENQDNTGESKKKIVSLSDKENLI